MTAPQPTPVSATGTMEVARCNELADEVAILKRRGEVLWVGPFSEFSRVWRPGDVLMVSPAVYDRCGPGVSE